MVRRKLRAVLSLVNKTHPSVGHFCDVIHEWEGLYKHFTTKESSHWEEGSGVTVTVRLFSEVFPCFSTSAMTEYCHSIGVRLIICKTIFL